MLFWSLFIVVGVGFTRHQLNLLRRSTPVQSEIVARSVISRPNRDGTDTEYEPESVYRYQFDGRTFTGTRIYPFKVSFESGAAGELARAIADEYETGQKITAYVNPDEPSQAFLRLHFAPYIFILFAVTMIFAGILGAVRHHTEGDRKRPSGPTIATILIWIVAGLAITGHYYVTSPPPYGVLPAVSLLCFEAVALTVLTQLTIPPRSDGLWGAVHGGVVMGTIGLYLGLMLGVIVLQLAHWLRMLGLSPSVGQYLTHIVLSTAAAMALLGAIGGGWTRRRRGRSSSGNTS